MMSLLVDYIVMNNNPAYRFGENELLISDVCLEHSSNMWYRSE